MSTPVTGKIALVAGQRFGPIDPSIDNETIRQQLVAMGFADVAAAEVKSRREGDHEVIEFVKKAGTKGLDGAGLAAVLACTPPADSPRGRVAPAGLHLRDARLLRRLADGAMSCQEVLDLPMASILAAATFIAPDSGDAPTREGERLCQRCDQLPAIAGPAPSGW